MSDVSASKLLCTDRLVQYAVIVNILDSLILYAEFLHLRNIKKENEKKLRWQNRVHAQCRGVLEMGIARPILGWKSESRSVEWFDSHLV